MAPTQADIARRANVTRATVSRIISGRADFSVSADKRAEVLRIAEGLNYRPKRAARALASGRNYTVSLVLGALERDLTSPAFSVLLTETLRTLWGRGYATTILPIDRGGNADEAVLETLRESHADGYIVPNVFLKPRTLRELQRSQTPVVSFRDANKKKKGAGYISYVEVDEQTAVSEVVNELYRLGHRRFCAFGFNTVLKARLPFFRKAIDCEAPEGRLTEYSYLPDGTGPLHDREQARQAARKHWTQLSQHTAILCTSDLVAMGVMDFMAELGIEPGREMSVIGMDNLEQNPSYQPFTGEPWITTIDRQPGKVGRSIAELLLGHMDGEDRPTTRTVPMRLLLRSTHGPPQ